ncbi:cytochrome c oxidase subunit I [Acuticoccus kandeliae]|uniref:cytochrome c oxidase subunit I n=1 Tax=Acuticoccus kandeliae TaxID=2073160 RepID=UPI000D3E0540|nr:cytochrome c oxidase subunit I [Acuticoccus kandeliae]
MTALARHRRLTRIWQNDPGFRGNFTSVNHTTLGKRFMGAACFFFLVGGLLAMLIRAQLASPRSAFVGPEIYNQLFTMHGSIMMFLFAIPMFEGLAVYLLPKLLGTRDLAFPRLTAFGFWCYIFGGSMLLVSLLAGIAPNSGWFMYTPLSSTLYSPGINSDFWLIGITFVEISAIAAAVEITVSVLKYRAPSMSLDKMPIFAWYILVTALMMLTGFPPLILGSVLLEIERAFGFPFFQAELGGDSLLWQHLFWFFGHPEVYIIFLPAAGVISTVLPVMARTTLLGYGWVVASALSLAFLSFGLWVHHMFTTGIPHMALAFFSAASTLVAIPTGIQIFAWIGTLWKGRPQMRLPMLYLLGFFATFVMGGLTGVMVAVVPFDWQAHDTAFITAHLHYVLVGGFVFPILAGAYYWLPHFTGRQRFFKLGEAAFWLVAIGFHGTFFAMHWVGLLGQPRRIETYSAEAGWTAINLISSIGSFIMAIGFALILIDLALQMLLASRGPRNPWRAGTLEWAMLTPAPAYNFASLPAIHSREPLADDPQLPVRIARGEYYLGDPVGDRRETLMVDTVSGKPEILVVLPGNSALPLWLALATGLFFLSLLIKVYVLTPVALLMMAALALRWVWQLGARADEGPAPVGCDTRLPVHSEVDRGPGFWGSAALLTADGTFFASLLFGYAFLWTIAPGWPPETWLTPSLTELGAGISGGAIAVVGARLAGRRNAGGATPLPGLLAAAAGLALLFGALLSLLLRTPPPTGHAYAATLFVLGAYGLFHAGLALLMVVNLWRRHAAGYTSRARRAEFEIVRLWADYGAGVGIVSLAAANLAVLP